ncbi:hypothetical protein C8J56DRAFT_1159853 [Mycena floridula]|nr:hypothetical protein C8J56DRAFT_1159853 [Mycena floridula]
MSDQQESGPLSDSDVYFLMECLIDTTALSLLHGIYSTLVVIALYKLCTRKAHFTAKNILIAATIIMFLCSTLHVAVEIGYYFIQLPALGYNPPDLNKLIKVLTDLAIFNSLIYVISDSVVVWRAWVIWPDYWWVRVLLIFCLFGTFVGVSIDFAFGTLFNLGNNKFVPTGPRTLILTLPLFLTNLTSTLLMGYKVWEYRAEIKYHLGLEKNTRTQIERVLILLTESGAIYCFLWLANCLMAVTSRNNQSLGYQLVTGILPQLTAIYPIIIILLVALEKANLQSTVTSPTVLSQPIYFASATQPPVNTIMSVDSNTHDTAIYIEEVDVRPPSDEKQLEKSEKVHFAE